MTFTCQGCGKLYNVSDSFAGKHVRCKLCGTAMTVPFLSAPAAFTVPVRARPLEYVQTEADAYVTFAGEELIDRFLPWGMLVLFLAFLVELIHKTYVALSTNLRPTPSSAYVSGFLTGTTLVWLVMVFGVVAPLLMLGVFIGSKIMDFRNKPLLYWRCAAVAMTPPVMILVVNGFNLNHIRDGWIWWIIMLVPMTGVLWLMLRLRVGQFSVAAAFALLCGVAAPLGLLFANRRPVLLGRSQPRDQNHRRHTPGKAT